ncbi:MAG TPA: tetratricopeptide repeat protein [Paracoccaceae bacterium]|nr:tetratricopeptide repeat protein [Paracoccaceae bacterium]
MRLPRARLIALAIALLALPGCTLTQRGPLDGLAAAGSVDGVMGETVGGTIPGRLPDAAESWLALGTGLLAAGQPDRAEDAFIRSLRVEGVTAAAFTGAGVAAHRQGLLTEATRYFERAKEIDPGSVAAHNNLGAALYGLGRLRAARHAFRTAFDLSGGTSGKAAQNLGMAELAIARAGASGPPQAAGPRKSPPRKLQRVGSAAYKLVVTPGTARDG